LTLRWNDNIFNRAIAREIKRKFNFKINLVYFPMFGGTLAIDARIIATCGKKKNEKMENQSNF